MKKTIEVNYEGQSYKVKTKYDGNVMVKVTVYHLARPNWKFFRYDYLDWTWFNLKEYETAERGVLATARYIISKENKLNESYKKFKDFMEKG